MKRRAEQDEEFDPSKRPIPREEEEAFWNAKPERRAICDHARTSRGGPWAVYGAVMARGMASVPPHVVIESLGDDVSLNIFVALAGRTGG